jgi:NADPH-dependent ferric siderophore reductase
MNRPAVTPNGRVLRHPGDLQWLERHQLQAADLFAQGKTKAEVAGDLGVSAQTASRWYACWRDGGTAGLRAARQASRPSSAPPSWPGSAGYWTAGRCGRVRQRPVDAGTRR